MGRGKKVAIGLVIGIFGFFAFLYVLGSIALQKEAGEARIVNTEIIDTQDAPPLEAETKEIVVQPPPAEAPVKTSNDNDIKVQKAYAECIVPNFRDYDEDRKQKCYEQILDTRILCLNEKLPSCDPAKLQEWGVVSNEPEPAENTPVVLPPRSIASFIPSWDESEYLMGFGLRDAVGDDTTADGTVSFAIVDAKDRVLYVDSFPVQAHQFARYNWEGDSDGVNAGYGWKVSRNEVKNGIGTGTAKITFTTVGGEKYSTSSSDVDIEPLSGEEIESYYEEVFLQNARNVEQSKEVSDMRITLVRIGHFTHLQYETWGDEITHYRADFVITNLSNDYQNTPSDYLIIDDGSNQYDTPYYGGTIDYKELHSGVSVSGHKVFDDVPDSASWIEIVAKKYNVPADDIWEFRIDM